MSVEWGKPKPPAGAAQPAAAPTAHVNWEQLAGAFPAWTLEPPVSLIPRKPKPLR